MTRSSFLNRMPRRLVAALAGFATLPALAVESAPAAPVAALYETRVMPHDGHGRPQVTRWYFLREADRVEVRDAGGATGELWERDPSGSLFYSRLFHDQRAQVEFAPTEFQTGTLNWRKVACLVDPALLGTAFKRRAAARRDGRHIEYYGGGADRARIAVEWRPDLALPRKVRSQTAERTTDMRLLRTWRLTDAPAAMTDPQTLLAYRQIDGADLGDMESDPLVKRVLAASGHAHDHDH